MKNTSSQIVYEYWDHLRGERAAPERGEVEPGKIRDALADTFVLEMDAGHAVFRLAGTRVSALFGQELKGTSLDDLWKDPPDKDDLGRLLDAVMNETAGAVAGLVAETQENERLHLEMLLLPLRHRGKTHARMLGAMSPVSTPRWLGLRPIVGLRIISVRMMWPRSRFSTFASAAARRAGFIVHDGGRSGI